MTTAQTPYRRVLARDELTSDARTRLEYEHAAHGPTAIWKEVEAARPPCGGTPADGGPPTRGRVHYIGGNDTSLR